jgi:hypothetical protein
VKRLLVFVLALAACDQTAKQEHAKDAAPAQVGVVDLKGSWKNERGSELKIDSVVDGKISGSFRSGVGRVDPSASFPLTGFMRGDVVGFVVDFGSAGSVGSWAGQIDGNRLVTTWHLARNVPDEDEANALWSAMLTGGDVFTRP